MGSNKKRLRLYRNEALDRFFRRKWYYRVVDFTRVYGWGIVIGPLDVVWEDLWFTKRGLQINWNNRTLFTTKIK